MKINKDNYIKWGIKNGFGINEEMKEMILDGLQKKKEAYGIAYCPCIPPYMHSSSMVCPCTPCRTERYCHCGMYKWE